MKMQEVGMINTIIIYVIELLQVMDSIHKDFLNGKSRLH